MGQHYILTTNRGGKAPVIVTYQPANTNGLMLVDVERGSILAVFDGAVVSGRDLKSKGIKSLERMQAISLMTL
jgi:hypothetical protein